MSKYVIIELNSPKVSVMNQNILKVSEENSGQRVDNFLIMRLKHLPKSAIYKAIRTGEVRVNKGRKRAHSKLQLHDEVRLPPQFVSEATVTPLPYIPESTHRACSDIIYEDENLAIFNKPSGWAVHGGSKIRFGLIDIIKQSDKRFKNAELVHRLDKETSGCLMVAKKRSALLQLHEILREGQVQKTYLALVQGKIKGNQILEFPLERCANQQGERKVYVNPKGKESCTIVKPIKNCNLGTVVQALPLTGRTHQIRVHLTHIGHPIAGDQKYGCSEYNQSLKRKGLGRLFLHAHKLKFKNIKDGSDISVRAELPRDLLAVVTL